MSTSSPRSCSRATAVARSWLHRIAHGEQAGERTVRRTQSERARPGFEPGAGPPRPGHPSADAAPGEKALGAAATSRPPTVATTPAPGAERELRRVGLAQPARRGCLHHGAGERVLAAHLRRGGELQSSSSTLHPAAGHRVVERGLAGGDGAGLVEHHRAQRSARSIASALRKSMPGSAPRPVPTMMAVGVARPRAHGQAITSTATRRISRRRSRRRGSHQKGRRRGRSAITAGTKHARHPVGEPLDRGLAALRLLDQADDRARHRLGADRRWLDLAAFLRG